MYTHHLYNYSLAATNGEDYEIISPLGPTLTFSPTIRSFEIEFSIINDILFELPETFDVDLSIPTSPPPRLSQGINRVVVTINDDEGRLISQHATTD